MKTHLLAIAATVTIIGVLTSFFPNAPYWIFEVLTYLFAIYSIYMLVLAIKWSSKANLFSEYKNRDMKEFRFHTMSVGHIGIAAGYMVLNASFVMKLASVLAGISDPAVLAEVSKILTISSYETMLEYST